MPRPSRRRAERERDDQVAHRLATYFECMRTVGAELDSQRMLEGTEEAETVEYINPMILFKAKCVAKTEPHLLTWDKITKHLTEHQRIHKEQIAVYTAPRTHLDAMPAITDPECPMR